MDAAAVQHLDSVCPATAAAAAAANRHGFVRVENTTVAAAALACVQSDGSARCMLGLCEEVLRLNEAETQVGVAQTVVEEEEAVVFVGVVSKTDGAAAAAAAVAVVVGAAERSVAPAAGLVRTTGAILGALSLLDRRRGETGGAQMAGQQDQWQGSPAEAVQGRGVAFRRHRRHLFFQLLLRQDLEWRRPIG